jgi:ribosomal protein S18 acetylase RimI-like enzyme
VMEHSPHAPARADVRRCGTLWLGQPLAESTPPAVSGVRLRAVQPDDAPALRRAMVAAGADQPELAEVRVRGGRLGYLAESGTATAERPAEVVAYGWIARAGDSLNDLGFALSLPPGEGWIYDCATVPAARGRGLYTALLLTMRAEMPSYGLEHAWIGTAPANWPSQRGIARAGFQKVADVDWSGEPATVYGVPGFPEPLLHVLAAAVEDEGARVVADGGVPWVEALLRWPSGRDNTALPEVLRAFRDGYGPQLHWTRQELAPGESTPVVMLQAQGQSATVAGEAALDAYRRALERVAPGLPWLGAEPPA